MDNTTYTLSVKRDRPLDITALEEIVSLLESGNAILSVNVTYMKPKSVSTLKPVKFTPASFKEN